MNKIKLLFIIGLFIFALVSGRLLWASFHHHPSKSLVVEGVLDLQSTTLPHNQLLSLDGEWEFFPNVLLTPNDSAEQLESFYLDVPSTWDPDTSEDSIQYGTYRLRILLNDDEEMNTYGIRVVDIQSASALYVNGQLLGQSGQPATNLEEYESALLTYSSTFYNEEKEIEVLLHVAQGDHVFDGGIVKSIKFGYSKAMKNEIALLLSSQLLLAVTFFIHAVYAGIIFFFNRKQKLFIYFMLLSLSATLMVFIDDDKMFFSFVPLPFDWSIKLIYFVYTLVSLFLFTFFKHFIPEYTTHSLYRCVPYLCMIYLAFIVIAPTSLVHQSGFLIGVFLFLASVSIFTRLVRMAAHGVEDIIFLLLAGTALVNNIIWSTLKHRGVIEFPFYPFDLFLTVVLFASYWFKKYFRNSEQTKKLTEQLQRSNQQKDDFLANTSHELRNPLHNITNMAQVILEQESNKLTKKSTQNLRLLITVSKRMSLMINDLLDVRGLQGKAISLKKKDVSLPPYISGVIDMLTFMTDRKSIQFDNKIDESFPYVRADEQRLIQILFNLLHNALKYTETGTITISGTVKGEKAYIHVKDTGIGMDQATQERIFQPYEQGDSSMTAMGGGIGLGLSICRELVELHGGSIVVTSTKGEGSIFTFSLPISNDVQNQEQSATLIGKKELQPFLIKTVNEMDILHAANKPRILAVDDDPINLHILETMLSEHYQIETTTSGKDALLKVRTSHWDLIISDVMMPTISGYQLTKTIRQDFTMSELPILLLTARSRPVDIHAGFLAGANDYVTKPVDALELKARVHALTDLKQSVEEHLRLEAAWLQAQIKPHFFFNTLNTILMLIEDDPIRTKELLEVFCHYLQMSYNFNNVDKVVPISDELDLVESYVFIMNERFKDQVHVMYEVDETIQDTFIPPLSIQPLIENALQHGFLNCSQKGEIHIQIIRHSDFIEVSVSDNGVGMSPRKIQSLFTPSSKKGHGVGLINIDRRLKQMYGRGLQVHSVVDEGTRFSFSIPIK
ncbi:ATP-binding protein [Alkalihalophilus sp. As8PL]|uniref:histidine kinase n=1 Tax=Alkalihalophilus sp. As8PL TaxID=3237103 RepID=A0AB39BVH2_9BACI